jgi:hypothetical protein
MYSDRNCCNINYRKSNEFGWRTFILVEIRDSAEMEKTEEKLHWEKKKKKVKEILKKLQLHLHLK